MEFKNITLEFEPPAAILTINRPDKLNALNKETLQEIRTGLESVQNHPEIKGVIITGSGEKAFVAGADLKEIRSLDESAGKEFAQFGQSVFNFIESFQKPVIAAVNGFALGGGCELAMSCHFRYAAENARFGQPEVNLGLIPGFGGTQRLPRLIGKGRALELLMSAKMISAEQAKNYGLVNEVFSQSELIPKAKEIIDLIGQKGPQSVTRIISAVNKGMETDINSGLEIESAEFGKTCGSMEKQEGVSAFLEKRTPKF